MASRSIRLHKVFTQIIQGKREVKTKADVQQFLEAICDQSDRPMCVEKLVASPAALQGLHRGLRVDISAAFVNKHTAAFISYLSEPSLERLCSGQLLKRLLLVITEPETLWSAMLEAYRKGELDQPAERSFAWLVLGLLLFPTSSELDIFAVARDLTARELFLRSTVHEIRTIGYRIQKIVQTVSQVSSTDEETSAGGRHDNDFADFRKIAIYPTADEFLSNEQPFLRRADTVMEASKDHRAALHLDNQFRLLREEMIAELREEMQASKVRGKRRRSAFVLRCLAITGVFCGEEKKWRPCTMGMVCAKGLEELSRLKPADRKSFLNTNRNYLKHQSFGCITDGGKILAFATVDRNEDNLMKEPPVVMLQILGDDAFHKVLFALKVSDELEFLVVNTAFFAFEPILKCLQGMIELPLAYDLLNQEGEPGPCNPPLIPNSLIEQLDDSDGKIHHILKTMNGITLDHSQLQSLRAGLVQTVSLIQGPPGTGKSFIGALQAKAFHDYTKEKILVICYTNHALDQFLEDLLNIGIPSDSMVRLGSKSITRTTPLKLSNQTSSYKRSKSMWDVLEQLDGEASVLNGKLVEGFRDYREFSLRWGEILEYLEFSDDEADFYAAFQVPEEEDGMTRVGTKGKVVGQDYLIDRWSQGQDAGNYRWVSRQTHPQIWALPRNERFGLLQKWQRAMLEENILKFCDTIKQFHRCNGQRDDSMREKTASILSTKRIIGCTTTAAAMHVRDLQTAAPSVILVEEAGEILESHVLTAMSAKAKQLILIGDHKQLRPKVNNYALTIEKGDGFDLNRSMFERLVLAGYPHTTLTNQHRMCPEISALVKHLTYPGLIDDKKTKGRPQPRGLRDRVIFFNHEHPEVELTQVADRRDDGAKGSKQNLFEADIVLQIVKYLAQQGYGTDKLVVLTPYLGQLHLLRDKLGKENDPILNDLDSSDLVRAGLLSQASAKMSKRPIRISTIDNYQGEESDIVIASLTRSNSQCDIGFMSAPQRLNVMLSRARLALVMVGNADTFMNNRKSKDTWVPLLNQLRLGGHLYDGLPIKCAQHPTKEMLLQTVEDFRTECPDGGCSEPCGTKLNCGKHDCPQKCHQLFDHSKMDCKAKMEFECPRGHRTSKACFMMNKSCKKCDDEDRRREAIRKRDLELDAERQRRQQEYASQLARIQDEASRQRQILKDRSEDQQRERVLQQQAKDLEDLNDRVLGGAAGAKLQPSVQPDTVNQNSLSESGSNRKESHDSRQDDTDDRIVDQAVPTAGTSSAQKDWEHQKGFEGANNDALDTLIEMIGLEDVKDRFLSIKSRIDTAIRQNIAVGDERFGAALLGNPGTGKTTVARLYGQFLSSVGALPGSYFSETTGSRLGNDGIAGAKKQIEKILENGGGVFFVDEAYQLTSGHNFGGAQVLDFLLAEVENLTGKVVFVLAGYNKQMESFFAHNPGIPSRFPHELQFKDYEDKELLQILVQKINKKYKGAMRCESGRYGLYPKIVARRIGRWRGRDGFGNARAMENALSRIADKQANRLRKERQRPNGSKPNDLLFTREDLIGPEPSSALQRCAAWIDLQRLIGLEAVKDNVKALFDTIQYNYSRELDEQPLVEYSLNRVFLGSPGTGKTSVAKLYGQILVDMGLLSNGEVVVKNPSDFVGSVLGESEKNTRGILASALGKVLVIDEAYGLSGGSTSEGSGSQSDPYKTAVVDTIVAEVQSTPGEDRCVLLLGYKDQMEAMFQKVNPGLSRRFPLDSAFVFEDFTDEELGKILDLKLKQQGFNATDRAKKAALEMLRRARNRPHFGNAGEVDIILNSAKLRYQRRLSKGGKARKTATFEPQDIDEEFDRGERTETNVRVLFNGVVGCESIVAQLEGYQEVVRNMKSLDMDPKEQIPFNFLFRGPPGTGKTTTARKIGKVFYDMGFLATAEVIEVSSSELVGQYVGQTGPKTQKMLEKALGKVLFVDEAYRLAEGHFAKEAMDEIVDCITKPKFAQKLVMILAGYDADINRLMTTNPGLTSRFPEAMVFEGLAPDHCIALLIERMRKRQKSMPTKARLDISRLELAHTGFSHQLLSKFTELSRLPNWANARDVETLEKAIFSKLMKIPSKPPQGLVVTEDIIMTEIDAMTAERTARGGPSTFNIRERNPAALDQQTQEQPQPTYEQTIAKTTTEAPRQVEEPIQPLPDTEPKDPRDAGVSDEIWQALERDKAAAEAQEEQYKRLLENEKATREADASAQQEAIATLARLEDQARRAANDEQIEAKRRHEEARLQHEKERRAREEQLDALIRKREAEEQRRKQEQAAQKKLREMGVCVAGFRWIKQGGGYRCAGGSHFVSDAQLGF